MSMRGTRSPDGSPLPATPSRLATSDLIDRLGHFEGPPEQFLVNLLAVQCHIAGAAGGAIIRSAAEREAEVVAVYPLLTPGTTAPAWLAQAVAAAPPAMATTQTAVQPLRDPGELYGQPAGRHLVLVPLRAGGGVRGLAAFLVETAEARALAAGAERLELTVSLLSLYEMRLTLQRRQNDLQRLRLAMETLAAVNTHERFAGAAMTLCNELSAKLGCERASLGFLKGRYVQLRAMSHTENFSRKMKVVQDLEAAMEECLDQDLEILHPAPPSATYVNRATRDHSANHGRTTVASLPLRRGAEVLAVLTLERPADRPFTAEEVESLRLVAELVAARLLNLHEHDRWFGARLAGETRHALAAVVGPKHTWIKLIIVGVIAGLLFVIFAKSDQNADGSFVIEATERQVVPAPFDGYLKTAAVSPGDQVEAGRTVLATLNTAELKLELANAEAEQAGYLKQASAAMRENKMAEVQMAQAQADGTAAKMALLKYRIDQATITARLSGVVLTGDLKRRLGAPVKTGEVLFEIAPLESLRAEMLVPEDQIAELRVGQQGELAAASYPEQRVSFTVERIDPVAEVRGGQNVFKVRARLAESRPWMRPGMEGVAKVKVGRQSYAWLATHRLTDWLRMKMWW